MLQVYALNCLLGFLLFLAINRVGALSLSVGYSQLDGLEASTGDMVAYNLIFRILFPQVFIAMVVVLLHALGILYPSSEVYTIVVSACLFRWLYVILWGRLKLIAVGQRLLLDLITILVAITLSRAYFQDVSNLIPNKTDVAGEFWLVSIGALYALFNRITVNRARQQKRTATYVEIKLDWLLQRFGEIISKESPDDRCTALIYAILILEDHNRPAFARFIERHILYPIGKARTFGVGQVKSTRPITDSESVLQASRIIASAYQKACIEARGRRQHETTRDLDDHDHYYIAREVATAYNSQEDYATWVVELLSLVSRSPLATSGFARRPAKRPRPIRAEAQRKNK